MTDHYPTSADLAAMRRTIEHVCDDMGAHPAMDCTFGLDGPQTDVLRVRSEMVPVAIGGAWPHEREHGIGASRRKGEPWAFGSDGCLSHEVARREANRLRREAWEREYGTLGHDGRWWAATDAGAADVRTFAPDREAVQNSEANERRMAAWEEHRATH